MIPRKRQGLCKLSSDAVIKARDDTSAQVNRILLTFVGAVIFCVLSLLTPDSALLTGGGEKLNVPLTGPVSFFGFMLLGPAVLIVLRVYLQIYVEYQGRLDRLAQAPILTPDKNALIRSFRSFVFYLLLPLATLAFWWKAAVFPKWGWVFAILATAVIAMHLTLLFRRLSWGIRAVISLVVTTLVLAGTLSFGISFRRPFILVRANLSDQWLPDVDLKGAQLGDANLSRANLMDANLTDAYLSGANLSGAFLGRALSHHAVLDFANLTGAYLMWANLSNASLQYADFSGADVLFANLRSADLSGANLTDVRSLTQGQLDKACGDADTRLPAGLSVKFCKPH